MVQKVAVKCKFEVGLCYAATVNPAVGWLVGLFGA